MFILQIDWGFKMSFLNLNDPAAFPNIELGKILVSYSLQTTMEMQYHKNLNVLEFQNTN